MPFIMKSRGLSRAVGMSQLLDTAPEIKGIIDRGELVPDHMVLDALLETVLNPEVGAAGDGRLDTGLRTSVARKCGERDEHVGAGGDLEATGMLQPTDAAWLAAHPLGGMPKDSGGVSQPVCSLMLPCRWSGTG
jgi:hypothetical protein